MTYVDVHRRLSTYDKDCAFRSIATQVLPLFSHFFASVANFFDILTHLKLSCNFLMFLMIFLRVLEVLGWFGDGFWEVFSRIFSAYIEKRDFAKISVSPRREHDF